MEQLYFDEFMQKNKEYLQIQFDKQKMTSRIIKNCEEGLIFCAQEIQKGNLVAFPTETVYGLGANALDEKSVLKIFKAKNRPLSDPVIVHVTSFQQALTIVDIDQKTEKIFKLLTDRFWPGPLTLILKANGLISPKIMANTGFVGIRYPNNLTAQKLINLSQRPIVAPSANLFCHVSPTKSVHVFNDLYDKDISIIDGETSQFGIESTVLKIETENNQILILRNGSVSQKQISQLFQDSNIHLQVLTKNQFSKENEKQIAPGQFLKHYAPNCDTFLLKQIQTISDLKPLDLILQNTVLIDFANYNRKLKNLVRLYIPLSNSNDLLEIMQNFYDALRQAENQINIKTILITDLKQINEEIFINQDFILTIQDKLTRCTQANYVFIDDQNKFFIN